MVFWKAQLTIAMYLIIWMILLEMRHYCLYLNLSSLFIWKSTSTPLLIRTYFPQSLETIRVSLGYVCIMRFRNIQIHFFLLCISCETSIRFFSCGSRSLRAEAVVHGWNRYPQSSLTLRRNCKPAVCLLSNEDFRPFYVSAILWVFGLW